jgi:hypothetical protein
MYTSKRTRPTGNRTSSDKRTTSNLSTWQKIKIKNKQKIGSAATSLLHLIYPPDKSKDKYIKIGSAATSARNLTYLPLIQEKVPTREPFKINK